MPEDYYIVLGIGREANVNIIKKAYRKAAKQYHPDVNHSDETTSDRYREIKDAYETLADSEKRKKYDIELAKQNIPIRINRIPEIIRERTSYFDDMNSLSSYIDDFFEGMLPGFFTKKGFRTPSKDIFLEIILTPSEALEGGRFPIRFPVFEVCPQCRTTGYWENYFCPVCFGYGRIKTEREFSLSIPPKINHGKQIQILLEDIGMTDVYLYLVVHIDPSLEDEYW